MMSPATSIERVPIDSLESHPQNPRQGDVGLIAESLRVHGQYRPVVAQASTRYVLAGNHTRLAAQSLGWTELDVVFIDVDNEQALRILLTDNRTSDFGSYDDGSLAALLTDLVQQTAGGLDGTGWDGDSLDALILDVSTPAIPETERVTFDATKRELACPECGHRGERSAFLPDPG